MRPASRPSLLWISLLPVSMLALGILVHRFQPPRAAARDYATPGEHFWLRLGTQAYHAGDAPRAIPLLHLAAAAHDLPPEGWVMLGEAYDATGNAPQALRAWKNAGDHPQALRNRYEAHRRRRDYAAAILDLQALLAIQPEAGWAYELGLLLAATQPEQAIPFLEQAARQAGSGQDTSLALKRRIQAALPAAEPAYLLLEAGRGLSDIPAWELAAEAFRGATALRPDYAEAWGYLGEARQHLDIPVGQKYSSAGLEDLELARQLDPDSLSANLFLALYWRRQGRPSPALEILENLAERHADNAVIQIELGGILAEKGDLRTALSHYLRAAELAPAETESWLALAGFTVHYQYQVRGVGLPAARQLLLLTPDAPAALDLLGQALLLLDDSLNAERFFRRAILVDTSYSPAHLHLAQVYLLRNAAAAARRELSIVIALSPGSAEAEFARRLLESNTP